MEKDIYHYLEGKILNLVDILNDYLPWLDSLRKKEYHTSVPSLDEFNNHGESIDIFYDTNAIRKQQFGPTLIALIREGEDGGLDGVIYDNDKKASELLRETVHSFAHKYNISTGDLL